MKLAMRKMLCFACVLCLCFTLAVPTWAADGNPLAGAGSMGTSGTVQGTITDDNKADYYKYTVAAGSSVELKIKFTSNLDAVKLQVLDADGDVQDYSYISKDSDTNQKTENVTVYLNPGNYYIGIFRDFWSEGNYTMSFTTQLLNNTDTTYDDTVAIAHQLPLTTKVDGILSNFCGDKIDIYKLNVTKPGVMKYNFKFYMEDVHFILLDADGNEIKTWYFGWNDNLKMGTEAFEIPLESGTYYVEVLRDGYDGKYTFDQSYTDIGSTEKEPNDSLETAQVLPLGQKAIGLIAMGKDTDFYKITVPTKRNLTFTVPSKVNSLKLYVYNADGEEVKYAYSDWNDNTKRGTLKEIYKLPAGTYYVQVDSSYEGTYTLTASTTKAPAQSKITTIKRTKKDWFGNRSIYLKYNKSTNAEGYQIYVAKNSKFTGASKYTSDKRTATVGSFAVGKTYYVKVCGYSKNSDGEYIYGKFSAVKKVRL